MAATTDDTVYATLRENILGDGSKTYDVLLKQGDAEAIVLPAVSLDDAITLSSKLELAIAAHTLGHLEFKF